MRFLIDECLSPALVGDAHFAGCEAYHLAHIGKSGLGDAEIAGLALDRDCVLVTNNAGDFRRIYAEHEVHPGLIVIVPNAERAIQRRLFRAALQQLRSVGDFVNKALDVDLEGDLVTFSEYELRRSLRR